VNFKTSVGGYKMARVLWVTKPLLDELKEIDVSIICNDGKEYPNPVGKTVDLDPDRPDNLRDQIRRLIRNELSNQVSMQGMESFEEANDLEIDDELEDMRTPYTFEDMPEEYIESDSKPDTKEPPVVVNEEPEQNNEETSSEATE